MNQVQKYQSVGEQLLPVIAYGDAAGLPYEGQPAVGTGAVRGLSEVTSNPYVGPRPIGTWSDDTHLSVVTAQSLIESNGYDLENLAENHVRAYRYSNNELYSYALTPPILNDKNYNSWGRSTTSSVRRLMDGVHPQFSGEQDGLSNGVLMKIAPLIYVQSVRGTDQAVSDKQIEQYTRMTHRSPEAIVASLVHGRILRHLLESDTETALHNNDFEVELYQEAVGSAYELDLFYDRSNTNRAALERILDPVLDESLSYGAIIEAAVNRGFRASETLMMAYGSFVLNSAFPDSVYRTVEMGGDADSTGSIVATMSLFLHGKLTLPQDYARLHNISYLEETSARLTDFVPS